ncbi:MAG: HAD-IIIA family hydrolase [Saprospiraceae bacterium]
MKLDHAQFSAITTLVFDVDGVFTDSKVLITEAGELLRTMNTRDGQAIVIALNEGYHIAIITKGYSKGVRIRFENLGVKHIYDCQKNKQDAFDDLKTNLGLATSEILYMGDDIPDIPLLSQVSIAACPKDAVPEVHNRCNYISSKNGGQGCVREVIEKVMRTQGKWNF